MGAAGGGADRKKGIGSISFDDPKTPQKSDGSGGEQDAALGRADTPAESAFLARPEFTALFMRSQLPSQARPAGETSALDADDEPRADMEKHARPAARPGAARLKILALHGFRQNGEVFRKRTRKMRLALEDIADLTFVTSPLPYAPTGDTREATLAAFGYIPDYPAQRVWWLSSDDNREYEGFDTSLAFLETVFREQGPFDGVLGFAQGGTLAAVLAAMQPHPIIAFRFAICLSAFPSRAEAHAAYMAKGSIALPSIHALGLSDILVTHDRSLRLSIVQRIVGNHGGTIRADGNSPRGTVFHVELPAAAAPPDDD